MCKRYFHTTPFAMLAFLVSIKGRVRIIFFRFFLCLHKICYVIIGVINLQGWALYISTLYMGDRNYLHKVLKVVRKKETIGFNAAIDIAGSISVVLLLTAMSWSVQFNSAICDEVPQEELVTMVVGKIGMAISYSQVCQEVHHYTLIVVIGQPAHSSCYLPHVSFLNILY